jgi:hypothetical protein
MIAEENAGEPVVHLLHRGEYTEPREQVGRIVPEVLNDWPEGAPLNRLGLAEWLLADDQPLFARVFMNRLWQQVFGVGLVATSEDFGLQGERTVHGELLDWLAVEFRESGWDYQHMLRLLLHSQAFRQHSGLAAGHAVQDPDNRYLARGPRYRLDGEVLRDQALAVSGLLNRAKGGAGVFPYHPVGLWEASAYSGSNTKSYKQDSGDALYRRSMYMFWKRTGAPPTMTLFDAPSRETSCVRRMETNTPMQSLVLLNETAFVESARQLAQRVLLENADDDGARLRWLYRQATGSAPVEEELAACLRFVSEARERYAQDEESAAALLATGESGRDESLPLAEHAAWTQLCSVLLSSEHCIVLN